MIEKKSCINYVRNKNHSKEFNFSISVKFKQKPDPEFKKKYGSGTKLSGSATLYIWVTPILSIDEPIGGKACLGASGVPKHFRSVSRLL